MPSADKCSAAFPLQVHVLSPKGLTVHMQTVNRIEQTSITVNEETSKSCQVSVTPSRGMPKKIKRVQLQFVMKDPQVRPIC